MKIVFYAGPSREAWNPDTLAAMGGSGPQVSTWQMAKHVALLGHDVTLFGDAPGVMDVFDGVLYLDSKSYEPPECDVLLSNRPDIFDGDDHARLRVLWMHDAHCFNALRRERALKIDLHFCLSRWHKEFYEKTYRGYVDPACVVITRAGTDQVNYDELPSTINRNPHRALFTSRPERGLDTMLSVWDRILEQVPDAELRLTSYADIPYGYLPERVEILGRIDPVALAHELLGAGVWAYPTRFWDTFNMAAASAMAAGCIPVCTPLAGLLDTVGDHGLMIQGPWGGDKYRASLVDLIVRAMTETTVEERVALAVYARERFSWSAIAAEWTSLFAQKIEEKKS
jgi:glycosyltransferase involved in cell wall biosynthesis